MTFLLVVAMDNNRHSLGSEKGQNRAALWCQPTNIAIYWRRLD